MFVAGGAVWAGARGGKRRRATACLRRQVGDTLSTTVSAVAASCTFLSARTPQRSWAARAHRVTTSHANLFRKRMWQRPGQGIIFYLSLSLASESERKRQQWWRYVLSAPTCGIFSRRREWGEITKLGNIHTEANNNRITLQNTIILILFTYLLGLIINDKIPLLQSDKTEMIKVSCLLKTINCLLSWQTK